MNVLINPN